jgi:hypothetical protein
LQIHGFLTQSYTQKFPWSLKISIQIRNGENVIIDGDVPNFDDYLLYFECAQQIEKFAMKPHHKKATWFVK